MVIMPGKQSFFHCGGKFLICQHGLIWSFSPLWQKSSFAAMVVCLVSSSAHFFVCPAAQPSCYFAVPSSFDSDSGFLLLLL